MTKTKTKVCNFIRIQSERLSVRTFRQRMHTTVVPAKVHHQHRPDDTMRWKKYYYYMNFIPLLGNNNMHYSLVTFLYWDLEKMLTFRFTPSSECHFPIPFSNIPYIMTIYIYVSEIKIYNNTVWWFCRERLSCHTVW